MLIFSAPPIWSFPRIPCCSGSTNTSTYSPKPAQKSCFRNRYLCRQAMALEVDLSAGSHSLECQREPPQGLDGKPRGRLGRRPLPRRSRRFAGRLGTALKSLTKRLVGLRTTVAREWITESARRPDEFKVLSEETMGLLSLARRADLLN